MQRVDLKPVNIRRRVKYGDERDPEMRAFLEKIAPMFNVDLFRNPMLLVAGENDPRVPLSETLQIAQALKDKGIERWVLVASDEGHGFKKKQNVDFQFFVSILFWHKHLLEQNH